MRSSWAGFYEYNTFDQNAIIGRHPDTASDTHFMSQETNPIWSTCTHVLPKKKRPHTESQPAYTIGRHPHVANMVLCNGFSGHGLQQSPAAGRAVAEIITGSAQTVDVSSLGFERVLRGEPVYEQNIV